MATVDRPATHRGEISLLVESAGNRFAAVAVVVMLGGPLVAYLSGDPRVLFYAHVALGGFWFGLDFFFKFVLGPSIEASSDEARIELSRHLVPKMVVVAEPLSVGVIGSGIALAELLGYWSSPTLWVWIALGIGILMLLVGFGPLHFITTEMVVEFAQSEPDGDRLDELFGKAMVWGLLQTILMLGIILAMTGLRWGL